jgi:TolB-like protein/DNA-binding winged helix-turn-helix (wHTH) protein/Flp pilus assembly protein TadD
MERHRTYRFGDFAVDPQAWKLLRDGREVHLEPSVLKLLIYLLSNRDRLVTRQELMDTVWGDTVVSDSALSKSVARLRQALDDDPANPRFIETVHARGYRFVAEVATVVRPDRPDAPVGDPRPLRHRAGLAAAGIVIALVLLIVFWPDDAERDTARGGGPVSLAVLPLENLTGQPGQDYLVDGLQDSLITALSQNGDLRVTSRQSTIRYRDSEQSLSEIARELGVDVLVEGSALRVGEQIEVNLQLVDGRSDEHLWARRYERDAAHVFDLLSDAARAIGAVFGARPAGAHAPSFAGAIDPRATRAYWLGLRNLDYLSEDSLRLAIEQFHAATELEPGFALAWGNLAATHAMQAMRGYAPARESIEKARVAATRAINAGDHAYIGHSTLGWVRLWTQDLPGACEAFRTALRLNPSAPYALHGIADCLMLTGRIDESVERTRELATLAPFTLMHNRPLSFHLFIARRYDEAIAVTLEMQERFPGFPMHVILGLIYWAQGDFDKALEEERRELELHGDTALLAALEAGLARGGPHGALRAMADALVARSAETYVDPHRIGETYARAGEVDEALYWLNRAVEQFSFEAVHLALRPDFDVLRDDPRFAELVARIGLQSPDG